MPKLLWVALPLLMLAPLAAWLLLRRQLAWRAMLNAWSSLLLLAYLATTAALGIFWVANQQLPVFDWHYLFGYVTLLLLAVHLALNFGTLWRVFTGRAPKAPPSVGAGATASGRRPALAGLGVLGTIAAIGTALGATFGSAFMLGQHHERRKAGSAGAAGRPLPATGGLAAVDHYHALSSQSRASLPWRAPSLDWGAAPAPFKSYPQAERIVLPPPGTATSSAAAAPIGLAALGAVLWHTAGITAMRAGLALRASPSSGALFATELYVVSHAVAGLAPALWHYDARSHALEKLAAPAAGDAAAAAQLPGALSGGAATVVASAVFARSGHKYGDRCYRYVLADLGHALENLRRAGGATGAVVQLVADFDEAQIAASLGLDQRVEGVPALARLLPSGAHATAPAPAPPVAHAEAAGALGAPSLALPQVAASANDVFETIRQRRSVRRFADLPLTHDALAAVLAAMAARGAPRLSHAGRIYVVVNAVLGVTAGAYRYDAARHTLVPLRLPSQSPTRLRAAAQAAALDQHVIGRAAAVFVLTLYKPALASDPAGPAQGYRHALLDAGMAGERIYLEAGARGLGACAVGAFYDDEAAALLAIDPAREWVLHFAALGVPQP